jgi:mannose-6-phosphate isomerase-like protein (cupin superfamily)
VSAMQYPKPRYLGDTGEISAMLRRANHRYDLEMGDGARLQYLATGAGTAGEFGLYRCDFTGPPTGAAPHFHRTISESFFILSGTVQVFDGRDWVAGRQGDFLFVPEGGIHGFRNQSGEPASMLLLFAPGAPREAFFRGFAEWAAGRVPGPAEQAEFMRYHDNHLVQSSSPHPARGRSWDG